jgi:formiminoglutamase
LKDAGDLEVAPLSPAACFEPIRDGVRGLAEKYELTIILGGNNAVTRPGVYGLGRDLSKNGLVTLDAHFDMRDTAGGLTNGNPVQALLDDGMPGENIAQIGIAPFANAKYMHEAAHAAGNRIYSMADCRRRGIEPVMTEAIALLAERCERLYVDFDIDVIERGLAPGAPAGRLDHDRVFRRGASRGREPESPRRRSGRVRSVP